jgi:hypothetical protein
MAFSYKLNIHNGTGQTSPIFFSQHHQLPRSNLKINSIPVLFSNVDSNLTNPPSTCQVVLEIFLKNPFLVTPNFAMGRAGYQRPIAIYSLKFD